MGTANKKIKFICLPGGGTSSIVFYKWFGLLHSEYRPSFIDLPGRGLRKKEEPLTSIEDITSDLYRGLVQIIEDGRDEDYVLFSYCMGSIFLYELYKRLMSEKKRLPVHIFIIAADIPNGDMYKECFITNPATKTQFYDLIRGCFPEHTFKDEEFLLNFRKAFVDTVYQKYQIDKDNCRVELKDLQSLKLTAFEDSFELRECLKLANDLIHILSIDCNICSEYQYSKPETYKFDCDITCISGSEDILYTEDTMQQWSAFTKNRHKHYTVKGGHRILLDKNMDAISIMNNKIVELRGT